MAASTEDIIVPFRTKPLLPGRSRMSNQQQVYPSTDKHFERFLTNHNSTILLENYGNKSGSLWEGNNLLQLGVVILSTGFWDFHPDGIEKVEGLTLKAPGLSVLLNALHEKDLQLPDAEILKRLKKEGASESMAVYCGLASLRRKPVLTSVQTEDFKRWAGRLRPRKEVRYTESSAEATNPSDPDFEPEKYEDIEEQAVRIIDEAEANDTAIAFIRMVLTTVQEVLDTTDEKQFPAVRRSPGKYKNTPTTLGTYSCWTDGSIVVQAFSNSIIQSPEVVAIAEIEVKRHDRVQILPQHISQLNAQVYRVVLSYRKTDTAKSYADIPKKDRTIYLICVNGTQFRVCWVTYKAEWLHSLFGPFSQLGVVNPKETETRLGIQEFHLSKAYALNTAEDREEAADILLYIAFFIVRIGYNYDEIANYTGAQ
ncbi:hypothetical protein J132_07962 [Termitomyces sp. J132]|nr:hypothetical protein J132_07962 [Termitomyces sp. J132]